MRVGRRDAAGADGHEEPAGCSRVVDLHPGLERPNPRGAVPNSWVTDRQLAEVPARHGGQQPDLSRRQRHVPGRADSGTVDTGTGSVARPAHDQLLTWCASGARLRGRPDAGPGLPRAREVPANNGPSACRTRQAPPAPVTGSSAAADARNTAYPARPTASREPPRVLPGACETGPRQRRFCWLLPAVRDRAEIPDAEVGLIRRGR